MSTSLYLVATPFPDEAPSSWIFRTAAMHSVSVRELLSAVNVRRHRKDLDLFFHERFMRQIVRGTDLAWNDVKIMARHFASFRNERWLKTWLRKTVNDQPSMAYCPACLASDVVPYWRSVWRYRYWVICPVHWCRVLDRCQACLSEVTLEDDLGKRPKDLMERWMACQCCGTFRAESNGCFSWCPDAGSDAAVVALQRTVTSALLHGHFFLGGFSQQIPLALLPGALTAGGYPGEADTTPLHDVRHRKELESAIRYHKRSGYEGFQPRVALGSMTTYRIPWIGDASELAERVLYSRFICPALNAGVGQNNRIDGSDSDVFESCCL